MTKLFTKHDPYHFHKTVGSVCLLHFLYRFFLLFRFGKAFPTSEQWWFTCATCGLHLLLHKTSFVFRIPAKRNFRKPMLWREFRRHNATFVTRNILGTLLCLFFWNDVFLKQHPLATWATKLTMVLVPMIVADLVTRPLGDKEKRTTNAMPYPAWVTEEQQTEIKLFYAQCQFHATMLAIFHPCLSFASVLGIEISSLCMTLVRKGKIAMHHYHQTYALCLWIVYPALFLVFANGNFDAAMYLGPMSSLAKMARTNYRVNKYLIWVIFVTIAVMMEYFMPLVGGLSETVHVIGCSQLMIPVFVNFAHIRYLWSRSFTSGPAAPHTSGMNAHS